MVSERTRYLVEARMKDIRRFQKKTPSGAQVERKFKDTYKALGDLSGALLINHPDIASQVDDIEGQIRSLQKVMRESEGM